MLPHPKFARIRYYDTVDSYGNLDQITDVDNVVILLAYPGRSINATSSLRLSLLYLR